VAFPLPPRIVNPATFPHPALIRAIHGAHPSGRLRRSRVFHTRSRATFSRREKETAWVKRVAAPPATPRRPHHSLPLLPSGPGGVCKLSSRGRRRGHRRALVASIWCGSGGESGIRTREAGISRLHTFQACSFNRSDISPDQPQRGILPAKPSAYHCAARSALFVHGTIAAHPSASTQAATAWPCPIR
jgi:hypothetical protein